MESTDRIYMGRYEAKALLGEGGMGRVYLAYQPDLQRKVVIKVMHDHIAADPKFCERFRSETLLMAQFQHPYAVTLYDASLDDPAGPCIVMEFIRGITLEKLLEQNKGRLGAPRISRLLNQLCEVLQAAHDRGIVHCDLKPANVMVVDPDTPYEKIKVMDFGLAKLHGPNSLRIVVDSGGELAIGTPAYMCPEQIRGDQMDHRGDLYSVGVMLYELLTGRLPFQARDPMDVMLSHATEAPPTFAEVGAAEWVPPAVEAIVRACLAKEADERPSCARELAQRYQMALEEGDLPPEEEVVQEMTSVIQGNDTLPEEQDPNVLVQHLEAWMPEAIAVHKLRGYLLDVGAEVVDSEQSRILVHLGKPGSVYHARTGPLAWLGIGRSGVIEMELRMHPSSARGKGHLDIAVIMRSLHGDTPSNPHWRAKCERIFTDLRAYLMGQSGRAD